MRNIKWCNRLLEILVFSENYLKIKFSNCCISEHVTFSESKRVRFGKGQPYFYVKDEITMINCKHKKSYICETFERVFIFSHKFLHKNITNNFQC